MTEAFVEMAEKYRHFPPTTWQQDIVYASVFYRLAICQMVFRLGIVVKELKLVKEELETLKKKFFSQ